MTASPFRIRIPFTALLVTIAIGCGGSSRVFVVPSQDLPRYTPADAALFDDTVAEEVFGLPSGRGEPSRDPKIIERTQTADAVVRARVATVTRDTVSGQPLYTIVMIPLESAWVPAHPDDKLELRLQSANPSIPFMAQDGSSLVGKMVVLFYKRYDDQGRARIHWRAEPDTPTVREAVLRAKQLDAER